MRYQFPIFECIKGAIDMARKTFKFLYKQDLDLRPGDRLQFTATWDITGGPGPRIYMKPVSDEILKSERLKKFGFTN